MAWPARWTHDRIETLKKLASDGLTRPQIAEKMGEKYDAVVTATKYYGILVHRGKTVWTKESIDDVLKKLSAGLSISDVSKIIGCRPATLQSVLQYRAKYELKSTSYSQKISRIVAKRKRIRELSSKNVKVKYSISFKYRHDLVVEADKFIPRGLSPDLRDDIRQEIIVAVLGGSILDKKLALEKIREVMRTIPQYISLDHPPPWARKITRPLLEYIDTNGRVFVHDDD